MRPVRKITAEEKDLRAEEVLPGRVYFSKRNPAEPEPVGTIVLMAFRVTGYDLDCDGSLMARLEHINKNGDVTGWEANCIGLYPDTDLCVTQEEWHAMFDKSMDHKPSSHTTKVCNLCSKPIPCCCSSSMGSCSHCIEA